MKKRIQYGDSNVWLKAQREYVFLKDARTNLREDELNETVRSGEIVIYSRQGEQRKNFSWFSHLSWASILAM